MLGVDRGAALTLVRMVGEHVDDPASRQAQQRMRQLLLRRRPKGRQEDRSIARQGEVRVEALRVRVAWILEPNDVVVTAGQLKIRDGAPVSIASGAQPPKAENASAPVPKS